METPYTHFLPGQDACGRASTPSDGWPRANPSKPRHPPFKQTHEQTQTSTFLTAIEGCLFRAFTVCNYFENNAHRMRYDEYLKGGYPIASGVIEGACRHIIKDRIEQGGMRWRQVGAEAMLNVRAVNASSERERFGHWRQQEEAKRVHPHRALLTAAGGASVDGTGGHVTPLISTPLTAEPAVRGHFVGVRRPGVVPSSIRRVRDGSSRGLRSTNAPSLVAHWQHSRRKKRRQRSESEHAHN
jgi:hypothetical protein